MRTNSAGLRSGYACHRAGGTLPVTTRGGLPGPQIVATINAGRGEAKEAFKLPHWRRRDGVRLGDLSANLRAIERSLGAPVRVGRAFVGKWRKAPADPFADIEVQAPEEVETGVGRVVRLSCRSAREAAHLADLLRSEGATESLHFVHATAMDRYRGPEFPPFPSALPGSWAPRLVRADEALELEPGDPNVLVAVLDSGVEYEHPELHRRVIGCIDTVDLGEDDPGLVGDVTERDKDCRDDTGHGVHVAGIIAARGLRMFPGLAGQSSILAVRVLGSMIEGDARVGVGSIVDIDDGLKFAVDEGASVVNMSLGVDATGGGAPHARMVRYARLHDVVVVAASGNHGGESPVYPGALPGVVTVGALTEIGRVAGFSGWGGNVDVVAPGTAIYSTDLGGRYRYRDGTSHAAPFVAGAAALVVSRARAAGLRFRESTVRRILRDTADRTGAAQIDPHSGAGVLNARDAILMASRLVQDHQRRRRAETPPDAPQRVA